MRDVKLRSCIAHRSRTGSTVLSLLVSLVAVATSSRSAAETWTIELDVSDGSASHARFVGADSLATDGHDDGLDIPLPPPPFDFFAYLAGPPPFQYYATDIRAADNPSQTWNLVVSNAGLFTVVWDSTAVPECVVLTIDGDDMKAASSKSFFGSRTIVIEADAAAGPCPAAVLGRVSFNSTASSVEGSDFTLRSTLGEAGVVGRASDPGWILIQGFWGGIWRAIATDAAIDFQEPAQLANSLRTPFPNPFRDRIWIRFEVRRPERVRLSVYDVGGRRVRTLSDEDMSAGVHEAIWDGRDQNGSSTSTGVYFLRLEVGPWKQSKKILKLR